METVWARLSGGVGALLSLLAAGGAVVGLVALVQWLGKNTRMEVTLPSLVIVGVLVIVLSLGFMAIAFSFRNMTDRTQALGLPDGSVRAVVALLLVVLFAILTISLYTGLSEGTVDSISQLSLTQKDALIAKMAPSEIVSVSDPVGTPPTYTVWHRSPASAPSQDFAKQLLVMIGTLVTAVASFYFGANTVASAQAAAARGSSGNVTINALDPHAIPRGSSQSVTIAGENVGSITSVTLSNGSTKVSGTNVLSNAGTVKFDVAFDPNAPTGDWDVTVSDAAGTQTKSPVRLTVTAAGNAGPVVTTITPSPITRGSVQTVTIAGQNLSNINAVKISSGTVTVSGSNVHAAAGAVTFDVTLDANAPAGDWDVTLTDASGTQTKAPVALKVQ